MSDYVHRKVVRLPFPIKDEDSDVWYEWEKLKDTHEGIWKKRDKNGFELGYSDTGYYIDWVYYYTYGDESGDWGNSRLLTQNELDVIKPYFDKLKVEYTDDQLRVVDYCYYNGCESPDYYDIVTEDTDHAKLFIN